MQITEDQAFFNKLSYTMRVNAIFVERFVIKVAKVTSKRKNFGQQQQQLITSFIYVLCCKSFCKLFFCVFGHRWPKTQCLRELKRLIEVHVLYFDSSNMPLTACLYPVDSQRVLHPFDSINRVFCTKIGQLITEYRSISYFTARCPLVLNNSSLNCLFARLLQD